MKSGRPAHDLEFQLTAAVAPVQPPRSIEALMARAHALAGRTLRSIADDRGVKVPPDLKRKKGWVGNLIEISLGTTAGSKPTPDFEALGVELKTLPLGANWKPKESTFVSTVPFQNLATRTWESSPCRKKMARILWVPVEADANIPLPHRRVASPFLWRLGGADESQIRADWEAIIERIRMGEVDDISASQGQILQMRPKGRSRADDSSAVVGQDGWRVAVMPRGFYLRARFTGELLARQFTPDPF